MPPPQFSVIVPTFNREELVGPTLDSVFGQRLTDFEVIVVDDGSTDRTLEVVRGYGDRVRVIEQPDNRGCAAARNTGAAEARGEYLAFLDSDDLWFPWTLEVFADAIAENDSPAFVAGRLFVFEQPGDVDRVAAEQPRVAASADLFAGAVEHRFNLGVAHGVVRREAYLAVGGCVERNINGTDSDVLLKMGDAPGFAIIKRPATLAYRRHTGRTTTNLRKGLEAGRMLLGNEARGLYPGGPARKRERMASILARTRGITARALAQDGVGYAMQTYLETFAWNLRLGRLRYLLGVPPMAAWSLLRRPFRRP